VKQFGCFRSNEMGQARTLDCAELGTRTTPLQIQFVAFSAVIERRRFEPGEKAANPVDVLSQLMPRWMAA